MSRSAWIEDRAGRGGMRWRARYRGPDKRIRSKSFARKVDAQTWLDAQVATLARGEWVDPTGGKLLFSEWAETVMAGRTHLAPTSYARDEGYLRSAILPRFGDREIATITPADIRQLVSELLGEGKAPATVHKVYQITNLIFRQAVNDGKLARTPVRGVDLPSLRGQDEMRFLTADEVATLADAIEPRFRGMVSLAAYGGLRLGEICGLVADQDLDFLRGTVTVRRTLTDLRGQVSLGPTKTRASRRTVSHGLSVTS